MVVQNKAVQIRHEILQRVIELIFNETLLEEIDKVPLHMRPRGSESFRCCIYRDRALIKQKIMAMLGFEIKCEADELSPLSDFVLQSFVKASSDREIMRVVADVCHGCQQNNYVVTNMCRGCLGRSCEVNCPKEAITIFGSKATINPDKCISCGICEKVCPYHAVIYAPVPCEEACPVGAISKSKTGKEIIDFDKCTYCGKCVMACPFGAIVEETHAFELVFSLKRKKKIVAMLAPSVAAQFSCTLDQMRSALLQIGFLDVVYVAEGAEMTIAHEAEEFIENGGRLMTTSCCPSFVRVIERHVPSMKEYVSHTASPMVYSAQIAKSRYPTAQTVFVGPCMAKKAEAYSVAGIDMVINFEELDAILMAAKTDPGLLQDGDGKLVSTADSWGFASTGGVMNAVKNKLPADIDIRPLVLNGIDRRSIKQIALIPKKDEYNFIEGMSCEGGCVGGCYMSVKPQVALNRIQKLKDELTIGNKA